MGLRLRTFEQPDASAWRSALVRRALAASGLALVAATWRLWTPQHVFPQVPLLGFATTLPAWCDWLGLAGMVGGLATALVTPHASRWSSAGLLAFVLATAGMVAIDGNRLQPWAYQFAIMALVLALADGPAALALLRLFVVSFYFYSALTKLDYSFLHTIAQQFLSALAGMLGATLEAWSDPARLAAGGVFPTFELLVALGLCFARTRTAALVCAVILHAALCLILGPWGLDHKPAVLIWNAYFIVQDVLLFAPWTRVAASQRGQPRVPWAVRIVMLGVVALPLLSPTAWFDMWPSWGLYAASAERVTLHVHRRELDPMPAELRPFVDEPADPDDPWLRVRIDRWALEALAAPIYPQSRHQLGVAEAVIMRYAPGQRARVARFDLADRFTGKRTHAVFASLPQLLAAGDEYYFNTRPRQRTFNPRAKHVREFRIDRGSPSRAGHPRRLRFSNVTPTARGV
jgi:hypothetical protein